MKSLLIAGVLMSLSVSAIAGGANTKTGIGDKNGIECAPGFYFSAAEGLCVAANWI